MVDFSFKPLKMHIGSQVLVIPSSMSVESFCPRNAMFPEEALTLQSLLKNQIHGKSKDNTSAQQTGFLGLAQVPGF